MQNEAQAGRASEASGVSPAERWSSSPPGPAGLRRPGDPSLGPSQAYRAGALSAPGPPGRLHPSDQRAPAPPSARARHPQLFQGHLLQEARRHPSTLLWLPRWVRIIVAKLCCTPTRTPRAGSGPGSCGILSMGGGSMQAGCGRHPGPTSLSLGGELPAGHTLSPGPGGALGRLVCRRL